MSFLHKVDGKTQVNKQEVIAFYNNVYKTINEPKEVHCQLFEQFLNTLFKECHLISVSENNWVYGKLHITYEEKSFVIYVNGAVAYHYKINGAYFDICIGDSFRVNDVYNHTLITFLENLLKTIREIWSRK